MSSEEWLGNLTVPVELEDLRRVTWFCYGRKWALSTSKPSSLFFFFYFFLFFKSLPPKSNNHQIVESQTWYQLGRWDAPWQKRNNKKLKSTTKRRSKWHFWSSCHCWNLLFHVSRCVLLIAQFSFSYLCSDNFRFQHISAERERAQRERLRDLAVFERLNGNPALSSPSLAVKKVILCPLVWRRW